MQIKVNDNIKIILVIIGTSPIPKAHLKPEIRYTIGFNKASFAKIQVTFQ